MSQAVPVYAHVWEDCTAVCMARMVGEANTAIVQNSVTSIACKVFDVSAGDTLVLEPTMVVATNVFNTLQTDARWTEDATGYNFRHTVPHAAFPAGGHTYRVEYAFEMADDTRIMAVYEIEAKAVRSS